MRKTFGSASALFAVATLLSIGTAPASADAGWEVCANLAREGGGVTACDFRTFEQCKATTGNSGSCFLNPAPRSIDQSFAKMPRRGG